MKLFDCKEEKTKTKSNNILILYERTKRNEKWSIFFLDSLRL